MASSTSPTLSKAWIVSEGFWIPDHKSDVKSSVGKGRVKSVLSGDSLLLESIGDYLGQEEKTISFAFVSAPRLRREGDEVR